VISENRPSELIGAITFFKTPRGFVVLAYASILFCTLPLLAQTNQPLILIQLNPGSAYGYGCCDSHLWPSLNFGARDINVNSSSTYSTAFVHMAAETSDSNSSGWPDFITGGSFDVYVKGNPGDQFRLTWNCTGMAEADGYVPGQNLPSIFYVGCGDLGGQGNFIHQGNQSGVQSGTLSGTGDYHYVSSFGHWIEMSQGGHRSADWVENVAVQIVRQGQQPPVAVIGPPSPPNPVPGTVVTLDGSRSYDPDGSIVEYKWTVQKPGGTDVLFGPVVKYAWNAIGMFNVTLTVTDNDGQTGSASSNITVGSQLVACKGRPKIQGANVLGSFHGPYGGGVYDGNLYHYGLASQDSSDPLNCTFDGYVFEEVFTLSSTCPFGRIRAFVSGLRIQHGPDPSGFASWVPDLLASPRVPISQSCTTVASQILNYISPMGEITNLTSNNRQIRDITFDPVHGSSITTTSFGLSSTTTYGY
jgi:hypothetical protein